MLRSHSVEVDFYRMRFRNDMISFGRNEIKKLYKKKKKKKKMKKKKKKKNVYEFEVSSPNSAASGSLQAPCKTSYRTQMQSQGPGPSSPLDVITEQFGIM